MKNIGNSLNKSQRVVDCGNFNHHSSMLKFTQANASRLTKQVIHLNLQPFNQKSPYALEKAFTLAEVLITLVIIGVVAAITVPILHSNTDDSKYITGRNKALATIGEAFRLAAVNGDLNEDISTKYFVENILAKKYLKILKDCTPDKATECGFSSNLKKGDGTSTQLYTSWSTATKFAGVTSRAIGVGDNGASWAQLTAAEEWENSHLFQTLDGFSVSLLLNPKCSVNAKEKVYFNANTGDEGYMDFASDAVCFNAVYDMNGKKGPNTIGKDIGFVGLFYNGINSRPVAVLPDKKDSENTVDFYTAMDFCKNKEEDKWKLPNKNELSLLYLNHMMLYNIRFQPGASHRYWTSTPFENYPLGIWVVDFVHGYRYHNSRASQDGYILCVRT